MTPSPQPDATKTRNTDSADAIARGTLRLLSGLGFAGLQEMTFSNNRRADIVAIDPAGTVTIAEVKSSVADFRSDEKWHHYMEFCDRFYFAVGPDFPQDLIPEDVGLIVADNYGGAVIRGAPESKLSAPRRKSVLLKFARLAATRLQSHRDADWTAALASPTRPHS